MAISKEKVAALKALLGDDKEVDALLQTSERAEKEADALGIAFKETSIDPYRLLDFALAKIEETEALKAKAKPADDDEDDEEDVDEELEEDEDEEENFKAYSRKMDEAMMGLSQKMDAIGKKMDSFLKKAGGSSEKSSDTATAAMEVGTANTERITKLEQTIKGLTAQLATATKELQGLNGDVPNVVKGSGFRATQSDDNVTQTDADPETVKEAGQPDNPLNGFLSFLGAGSGV